MVEGTTEIKILPDAQPEMKENMYGLIEILVSTCKINSKL